MILQHRDGEGALADGGKQYVGGNYGVRGLEAEAFEAGTGKHDRVGGALAHLAHARVHVAPDADDLQVGPVVKELGFSAKAGRGDHGFAREIVQSVSFVRDEHIGWIVAAGYWGQGKTPRGGPPPAFLGGGGGG